MQETEEQLKETIELVFRKLSKPVNTIRHFTDQYARDTVGDYTIKELARAIAETIIEHRS